MAKIKTGQRVRDPMSGLEGTVLAVTEWLYGCVRITIQPDGSKDGVPFETFSIDEPQCEVIRKKSEAKKDDRHGPRPDPVRREING